MRSNASGPLGQRNAIGEHLRHGAGRTCSPPVFAGKLNARFAVTPRSAHDAHRPLRPGENLTRILAMQTNRVLSKNLTLQYDNVVYQIQTTRPGYAMRNAQVIVRQEREGAITISYQGHDLNYSIHHVQTKQAAVVEAKSIDATLDNRKERKSSSHSLNPDHPWRRSLITPRATAQCAQNISGHRAATGR